MASRGWGLLHQTIHQQIQYLASHTKCQTALCRRSTADENMAECLTEMLGGVPPEVLYTDRDCFSSNGSSSKYHLLFEEWGEGLYVRLDI